MVIHVLLTWCNLPLDQEHQSRPGSASLSRHGFLSERDSTLFSQPPTRGMDVFAMAVAKYEFGGVWYAGCKMVPMHVVTFDPNVNLIQHTLGAPNLTLPLLDNSGRMPYSHGKCLERTLSPVVIIVSPEAIHMQRSSRCLGKALQAMRNHLAAQVTNLLSL